VEIGRDRDAEVYLHCRIRKMEGRYRPDKHAASMTLAREELRDTMEELDREVKGVTDKSFKCLDVTETLAAGATIETVQLHGRWKTPTVPLRYKYNSLAYKLGAAGSVPF